MAHPERTIQARLVARIRANLPDLPFWPGLNGIALDSRTALIASQQGNRKGIPDLVFPTMFFALELKAPGKHPTLEQLAELETLRQHGWETLVTDDIEEAWTAIVFRTRRVTIRMPGA